MSVLIKNMDKPTKCMWMDEKHDVYCCPLLDNEDHCRLQDCKEEWTWDDQYAGCPIEILPSAQPEITNEEKGTYEITESDKISYAAICDKFPSPHVYFNTYDEAKHWARLNQPNYRPYYIIKRSEHFEIAGEVR